MTAQNRKKKFGQKFFAFLNVYYPKPIQSKLSILLILQDQMEDYHKIQKQEALGNYFCLKMIPKLAPQ